MEKRREGSKVQGFGGGWGLEGKALVAVDSSVLRSPPPRLHLPALKVFVPTGQVLPLLEALHPT
jgi:hypothetical protein